MLLTSFTSPANHTGKSPQHQSTKWPNSSRHAPKTLFFTGNNSNILPQSTHELETFEQTSLPNSRKNTPEESARAVATFKRLLSTLEAASYLNKSARIERMLASNIQQPSEFTLPIYFTPNTNSSSHHSYFRSDNPEFNQVLDVLNKRIERNEVFLEEMRLKKEFILKKLEWFSKEVPLTDEELRLKDELLIGMAKKIKWHTEAVPLTEKEICLKEELLKKEEELLTEEEQLVRETLLKKEARFQKQALLKKLALLTEQASLKEKNFKASLNKMQPMRFTMKLFSSPTLSVNTTYKKLLETYGEGIYPILHAAIESGREGFNQKTKAFIRPLVKLDSLLGQEFSFDTSAPKQIQEFFGNQLGFGLNQLIKIHPEEQSIIRSWRIKSAARYALNRASTINNTWTELGLSSSISAIWGFALDIVGKNFALASLFKPELSTTNYHQLSGVRKTLLGIPDQLYKNLIQTAGAHKKAATVAIGLLGQGTVSAPDMLLLQGAIQNSNGADSEALTKWQRFKKAGQGVKWALQNKKLDTSLAVLASTAGTSFEKTKELLWVSETLGAKFGFALTGYFTNAISALSCSIPILMEGGPQKAKAARIMAKLYHPLTGILKLSEAERSELAKNATLKGIENFFERKAEQKLLHNSPTSKLLAASVPIVLIVSALPSTLNAVSKFIPDGLIPEIIKTIISCLQVPLFGPIDLLALNIVAKLNRSHPQLVTKLSRVGRPIIKIIHTPFSKINKGLKGVYSYFNTGKWTPVYKEYEDYLRVLKSTV